MAEVHEHSEEAHIAAAVDGTDVLYCEKHGRETTLRCNRCEKPICSKCAVRTPTGYRCEECVRGQQKAFDTANPYDFVIAIPIAAILSFIGSLIVPRLGFFTIFLAPGAGAVIAEVVRRVLQRRRSRQLFRWTTVAVAVASLFPILSSLFIFFLAFLATDGQAGIGGGFFGFGLIWNGLYSFMVTSTFYYRLTGMELRA